MQLTMIDQKLDWTFSCSVAIPSKLQVPGLQVWDSCLGVQPPKITTKESSPQTKLWSSVLLPPNVYKKQLLPWAFSWLRPLHMMITTNLQAFATLTGKGQTVSWFHDLQKPSNRQNNRAFKKRPERSAGSKSSCKGTSTVERCSGPWIPKT